MIHGRSTCVAILLSAAMVSVANAAQGPESSLAHYLLPVTLIFLVVEAVVIVALSVRVSRNERLGMLLQRSEQRDSWVAEDARMGLWSWDAKTDRFQATDLCCQIFGISGDPETPLAAMMGGVHPDDRAKTEAALRRATGMAELRFRLASGDGPERWIRTHAHCALDRDGKIESIFGTVVDITDSRLMRAEMNKQRQSLMHLARVSTLRELSGTLAHELNQPLTAIMSNAQAALRLLDRQPTDISELKDTLEDVVHNSQRAREVIRHMRAFLKNENSRYELLDLNDSVKAALEFTRGSLSARRIKVAFRQNAASQSVMGDSIQVQQLLLNLIMNAADAMSGDASGNGVLTISLDVAGDDARHIAISDTGPGLRPDILDRLFEPFCSTKPQGLGLGLSISRSIVLAHGGKIWAESNPGRGATFHVLLPSGKEVPREQLANYG